jgi:predicted esterase
VIAAILLALVLPTVTPATPEPKPFSRGEIVPRVVCEADPERSYALYLPTAYDPERAWPLLYLYDPRSHGAVAAERFREAAETYGWILASSNDTASDDPTAPNASAVNAMWADTHRRFRIDSRRVYASGFSGGARLAVLLALQREGEVAGVIAAGGGFPDSAAPRSGLRFDFFGSVGNLDFNYGEMRRLDRTLARLGVAHRLAIFEGPHSWCPAPTCREGIEWLELQAMKKGGAARDPAVVGRLLRERREKAAADESAGRAVEAWRRYAEAAEDFQGLADTADLEKAATRLEASAPVRKALAEEEKRDDSEARRGGKLRADLLNALAEDPLPPLNFLMNRLQLGRLKSDATSDRSEPDRLAAARVLESIFVQTAFYLPRDFAARHDFVRAELLTGIAAELKPDRAGGVFYNLACFRALAGDRKGAIASLRVAVARGYKDLAAMESDPDLASLRGEKAYLAIVADLKGRATS